MHILSQSDTNAGSKKAMGCGAGCLTLVVIFLAGSLINGYRTGWDGKADAGDPGYRSGRATTPNSSTPASTAPTSPGAKSSKPEKNPNFDFRPHTAKEKQFHSNILSAIGTPGELKKQGMPLEQIRIKTPNVYWGTVSYVGLRVVENEVHVAIRNGSNIPAETLNDLPRWYGNMAGDTWAYRENTWVLVDYKTGERL
ncbi:hypothetical protein [Actinomadura harenae]|uniref:hypothetical protein n=1 Tax=Actinomadura harenae TaxID=2483351 RepID=UPI0011C3D1BE|nr:hypothetical protein [Actinomadura harenae]